MELNQVIKIARGDEPADLLLKGGQIVNVFSGEVHDADVAIADGKIVAVGSGYTAKETIDVTGQVIAPGFIDAHVHIESSLVPPPQFARAVVPRGTTTVITDPHEIANVLGLEGIRFMFDAAKYNPLSMFVMLPSCVPATDMETSGATLRYVRHRQLQGLSVGAGPGRDDELSRRRQRRPRSAGENQGVFGQNPRRARAGLVGTRAQRLRGGRHRLRSRMHHRRRKRARSCAWA